MVKSFINLDKGSLKKKIKMNFNESSKKEYFVNQILVVLKVQGDSFSMEETKRHIYSTLFLDNLLPKSDVDEIYAAFPSDGYGFFDRDSFREKKRTSADLSKFDNVLSDITYALQDSRIINKVSELCSMKSIEPDPKLYAGGL